MVSQVKGEIEVDKSHFGAKRVKGKRVYGTAGKKPCFGILQQQGKVYTEPDFARETLQGIIRRRVSP